VIIDLIVHLTIGPSCPPMSKMAWSQLSTLEKLDGTSCPPWQNWMVPVVHLCQKWHGTSCPWYQLSGSHVYYMHFIMLYCFYKDCLMKILKNKHSCNVSLDFNNKITFIVPKLIMIAQSHIRRLSSSCEERQHKRFLSLLGLLSYPSRISCFLFKMVWDWKQRVTLTERTTFITECENTLHKNCSNLFCNSYSYLT